MKNKLLETLVAELNGNAVDTIPKGAVSAEMLADTTGLSRSRTSFILKDKAKKGLLTKIMVKRPGLKAIPYYVEAK